MGVVAAATLAMGELLERRDQDCIGGEKEGEIEEIEASDVKTIKSPVAKQFLAERAHSEAREGIEPPSTESESVVLTATPTGQQLAIHTSASKGNIYCCLITESLCSSERHRTRSAYGTHK